MRIFKQLLQDEFGAILSAEAVVIGTIAVIGVSVGLNAASKSVNAELFEFASAIRHLDQSYSVSKVEIDGDWTAGSAYTQPDVKKSMKELEKSYLKEQKEVEEKLQQLQKELIEREKEAEEQETPRKKRRKKQRDESKI
ncbi:hypothetical protein [Thalassoglobus polymorphus]|uniref:Uncharacterized protein n=1 Tax=Thalassoglobus polymorphus TaxID=2527994 RepID=A0A517QPD0_9PLAN|nr:hypothetical protein [Thalassoglobus polymorphus]QDT33475.1 hypothetical protein Mal48_27280 [Thalassoglobus polymorphus]